MSTTDEIKARIDIVDLVSETVNCAAREKKLTGFCPFHANSRTPAFVISRFRHLALFWPMPRAAIFSVLS